MLTKRKWLLTEKKVQKNVGWEFVEVKPEELVPQNEEDCITAEMRS